MIRWSKLVAGAERYYLGPARSGAEPPGRWWGSGAGVFDLGPGAVAGDDLAAVLAGRHPAGGERLTPRPTRVAGFDLTLAAPKSVSVLWGLAPAEVAAEVDLAHRAAAEAALGYLERRAVPDGSFPGPLVAAGFSHHLSRASDPHLHIHVVVANLRGTPDGGWRALASPPLLAHLPAAGFLFEAHLRHELTRRLAVRFGPVVDGVAQLEGVDAEVRAAFSSRRQQVRRGMAEHGGAGPRSALIAALDGRPAKGEADEITELRSEWRQRAERLGLSPAGVAGLTGGRDPAGAGDQDLGADVTSRLDASSFSRRDVIRAVCAELPGGAPVEEAERAADRVLGSASVTEVRGRLPLRADDVIRPAGRLVPVGTDTRRWTTRAEAARQQRLATDATRAARSGAGIELLSGPPGPARWSALAAARLEWQAAGLEVGAVAPDQRSARELEAATGIATTVADGVPTRPPAVLVVSGAERLSSRDASALVELCAAGRSRIVLVGDPGAVSRVDRAGAWRALESAVGARRLGPPAPDPPSRRPGGTVVRVGPRLVLAGAQEELRHRLVGDWVAAGGGRPDAASVLVAMRRPDVDDLNRRAGALLLSTGHLGDPVAAVGREQLHDGETVLVAGGGARGSTLRPGGRWVLDAGGGRLLSSTGGAVPLASAAGADLRRGYAMTPYQARLVSPAAALVLGDPLLYRESPGPADCFTSFYAVADLGPEGWARDGRRPRLPSPGARAAPLPGSLDLIEEQLAHLRGALDPPADRSEELAAAGEERRAGSAALARIGRDAPEAEMWERRSARAADRIDDLRAAAGRRRQWTADHAVDLARYADLLAAGAARRQALARGAELEAPDVVASALGPRPDDPTGRDAWRQAAGRLLSYRERWGLASADSPLGPTPADPRQAAERREVTRALRSASRSIGTGRHPGRALPARSSEPAALVEPTRPAPVPELR